MKQAKTGGDMTAVIKSVFVGLGVGLLVIAVGCVLTAACVQAEIIREPAIRYCAWAICALSAAAGCVCAQKLAGRAKLPVSLAVALLLLTAMAAINAAMRGSGGSSWHSALIVTLTAVLTALLTAGRGNRRG